MSESLSYRASLCDVTQYKMETAVHEASLLREDLP